MKVKKVLTKFSKLLLVLLFIVSTYSNNIYKPVHNQSDTCIRVLGDGDYSWMLETR
jgi:hypothetical protein